MIEIDPNKEDLDENEESDSEAEEADAGYYKLCKCPHGEGTSSSGAVRQVPQEEARQEERQKVLQDPTPIKVAQPSVTPLAHRQLGPTTGLLPTVRQA